MIDPKTDGVPIGTGRKVAESVDSANRRREYSRLSIEFRGEAMRIGREHADRSCFAAAENRAAPLDRFSTIDEFTRPTESPR